MTRHCRAAAAVFVASCLLLPPPDLHHHHSITTTIAVAITTVPPSPCCHRRVAATLHCSHHQCIATTILSPLPPLQIHHIDLPPLYHHQCIATATISRYLILMFINIVDGVYGILRGSTLLRLQIGFLLGWLLFSTTVLRVVWLLAGIAFWGLIDVGGELV